MILNYIKGRIRSVFHSNAGDGYLLAVIVCMVLCMVLSVAYQIIQITIIGNGIRNNLEDSVRYTVTKNWANVFGGSRQGYTGAYQLTGNSFQEAIDKNDVMAEFRERMDLTVTGGRYQKHSSDGKVVYEIYDCKLDVKNSVFTDEGSCFDVNSSVEVTAYMRFLGTDTPVSFTIKVKTAFSPLF